MRARSKFSVFNMAHLNLRSIFTGFQELVGVVRRKDFDVLAVSETWLNSDVGSDVVQIGGYNFHRCDRSEGRGGGVGIYVKDSFHSENLPLQQEVDGFENLWVKIKINCKVTLLVGVIYRTKNNILNCVQLLDRLLPEFLLSYTYVAVLGDLNVNMMPENMPNPLSDVFDTFGFSQVINEPTRITSRSSSLLDPIFISNLDIMDSAGTLSVDVISDHDLTFCKVKFPVKHKFQKHVTFRDFTNFREDIFYVDLYSIPWDQIFYFANIEEKVRFFMSHLSALFNEHAPSKLFE